MATSTAIKDDHLQVRKRGFWLKAYLFYNSFILPLTILFLIYIFIALLLKPRYQFTGTFGLSNVWWLLIVVVLSIINLVCLIGAWYWKRWGVSGILFLQLLGALFSLVGPFRYYSYLLAAAIFLINLFWCVVIILVFRPYWRMLD